MLKLNPSERLGAGGENNDYQALKQHAFFKDVDFESLLDVWIPLAFSSSDQRDSGKSSWTDVGKDEENIVVYQGELKKKNRYFIYQARFFVLTKDGALNYYKDQALLRGSIRLCKDTRIVKVGKDKLDIVAPSRTFHMCESDKDRLSIDTWIDHMKSVIERLKQKNS